MISMICALIEIPVSITMQEKQVMLAPMSVLTSPILAVPKEASKDGHLLLKDWWRSYKRRRLIGSQQESWLRADQSAL